MVLAAIPAQGLLVPMSSMGVAASTVQPTRACSGAGAGVSGCINLPPQRSSWKTGARHLRSASATGAIVILPWIQTSGSGLKQKRSVFARAAIQEQEKEEEQEQEQPKPDAEETTRKKGLEAGLWQIFTSKEESKDGATVSKSTQAKDLLTRYGGAYLATSISLSVVSFGLCYVLVSNGVDVTALLEKVGIHTNETGEKVGTFALAYAAHKAASPIRFPPTVALTPIVAGWFGKKPAEVVEEEKKP
ncbi:unnamed protein product [Calypogeia fissa]